VKAIGRFALPANSSIYGLFVSDLVTDASAGSHHSLALLRNGSIFAWTWDTYGLLQLPASRKAVKVAAGVQCSTLAILDDMSLVVWAPGCADKGSAFPLSSPISNGPKYLFSGVLDVAARAGRAVVALNTGRLLSIDLHRLSSAFSPVEEVYTVPLGTAVRQTAVGGLNASIALALTSRGQVLAFGSNVFGQLDIPVEVQAGEVIKIGASYGMAFALLSSGQLVIWGEGFFNTSTAAQLSGVVDFAAGGDHLVVLQESGEAWAYGSNSHGQVRQVLVTARLCLGITDLFPFG
jgi:hypothetical protein